jgi:hypothetical protein
VVLDHVTEAIVAREAVHAGLAGVADSLDVVGTASDRGVDLVLTHAVADAGVQLWNPFETALSLASVRVP